MSDDQDGCEWVNVSSGTGLLRHRAVKRCVCKTLAVTDSRLCVGGRGRCNNSLAAVVQLQLMGGWKRP